MAHSPETYVVVHQDRAVFIAVVGGRALKTEFVALSLRADLAALNDDRSEN